MSKKVAEKLIDIGSVQFSFNNHFILTSGLKSPVYVDCRRIISFVEERDFIMSEAINYFEKNNLQFDLIAGGDTAGIPYAAIISEKVICFANYFSFPNVPERTGTQRASRPRISIFYQSVNPFD